jgi:ATP-dependent RNA helicase DDX10/DBP4
MVLLLSAAKIPISEIQINPSQALSITSKLSAEVAADPDLKFLAQKCFSSYVRSILLQRNRSVFDPYSIPFEEYSESLGLAIMPAVKLPAKNSEDIDKLRADSHAKKNENKSLARLKASIREKKEAKKQGMGAKASEKSDESDSDDDDLDDEDSDSSSDLAASASAGIFKVKKSTLDDEEFKAVDKQYISEQVLSSTSLNSHEKNRIKRIINDTEHLSSGGVSKCDDGLTPFQRIALSKQAESGKRLSGAPENLEKAADQFAAKVAARLAARSEDDKQHEKERVRTKHREARMRASNENAEGEARVVLGSDEADEVSDEEEAEDDDEQVDEKPQDPPKKRPSSIAEMESEALALMQSKKKHRVF